jgi:hypothetical protein
MPWSSCPGKGTTSTSVFIVDLCVAAAVLLVAALPILWAGLATAGLVTVAVYMARNVRGGKM